MSEMNSQHMMICASRRDRYAIRDMLEVLVKWGVFKRENATWEYNAEDAVYTVDIRDVDWKTATFIGEILEAGVGHELKWYHYNFVRWMRRVLLSEKVI